MNKRSIVKKVDEYVVPKAGFNLEPITKGLWTRLKREIDECRAEGKRPTVAAFIRRRGEYLLSTSSKGPCGGYFKIGVPKGGVRVGESVFRALYREVLGEVNIRLVSHMIRGYCGWFDVKSLSATEGYTTKRYYTFYIVDDGPRYVIHGPELSGVFRMTYSQIGRALGVLLPEWQGKHDVLMEVFSGIEQAVLERNPILMKEESYGKKKKKPCVKKKTKRTAPLLRMVCS